MLTNKHLKLLQFSVFADADDAGQVAQLPLDTSKKKEAAPLTLPRKTKGLLALVEDGNCMLLPLLTPTMRVVLNSQKERTTFRARYTTFDVE